MAFPSVVNSALTESTTNQASHAITMPSSISAGNLLVCKARGSSTGDFTQSDGWTPLFAGDASDASSGDRIWIGYKVAAGSDTLTLTSSGTPKVAAITWQISGAGASPTVELSSAAFGASTTPEPPSFSPTGGAKDYLWLWAGGWEGEQTSPPSGQPSGYSGPIGADTGTAGSVAANVQVGGAWLQENTATEDPPSWTISVTDDWTAYLIAVHPAGAAPDPITGTSAVTAAAATMSSTGKESFKGTSAVTSAAATESASGKEAFRATSAVAAPAATVSATGSAEAGDTITGTSAVTAAAATTAASGKVAMSGASAVTTPAATAASSGKETLAGTSAVAAPAATFASTGKEAIAGTSALVAAAAAIQATGLHRQNVTGTSAVAAAAAVMAAIGNGARPEGNVHDFYEETTGPGYRVVKIHGLRITYVDPTPLV